MRIDTKATTGTFVAEIKSTSALTKSPFGSFSATLSVPVLDRDKEVVDAYAFDPLPDHITIDVDHAMTVEKTVASGTPVYDKDGLLQFEGTYASHPLAQMVRSLVDEGHIRTVSVAFMNAVREIDEKDGNVHVRKGDLVNAGIVAIPANTEALITASKALNAFMLSVPSGAVPGTVGERNVKSVVGSYEHQAERLRVAVRAAYPQADFVWVRATFADAVVFDMAQQGLESTFKAEYTDDPENGIVLGDALQVDIAEVVLPTKSITDTNPETKVAASAATKSPAAVEVARAAIIAADMALLP